MKKFLIVLALIILPQTAIAQTATDAGVSDGAKPDEAVKPVQDKIDAPAAPAPTDGGVSSGGPVDEPTNKNKVDLVIAGKNKITGRLLGGISVTMSYENESEKIVLNDPPRDPEGQTAFSIVPGRYKVVASRAGYKTLSDEREFVGENLKLTLEMEPLANTPDPDAEFARRIQLIQLSQIMSGQNQQFPYNQQNPFQTNPPFMDDIPFDGYQYPQNGYIYSNNQQAVIPIAIEIPVSSMISNYRNYDIRLIDQQTGNEISISSNNNYRNSSSLYTSMYPNLNRYGCLRPGQPYILRIANQTSIYGSSDNYQDTPFLSATSGGYTKVTLIEEDSGALSFAGPHPTITRALIQNLALQPNTIPINCPNNYATSPNIPGNTTWGDQSMNTSLIGNYRVEKYMNRYVLVSSTTYQDFRPITFVENNAGEGGLAFVPAQSGNLYSSASSGQWYMTTYTRNISKQLSTCTTYVSSLIAKPEFKTLDATTQTQVVNFQTTDSTLSSKEKLTRCYKAKDILATSFQKLGVAFPAMIPAENEVSINVSRFTRVNLSPSEYSRVVSGKVIEDFDVK